MLKMSIFQLGVVVLALCLTTQVVAQSNMTSVNGTMHNTTVTMAPGTYSSSTNATSPTGAGVPLQAGTIALLTPLLIILHRYC